MRIERRNVSLVTSTPPSSETSFFSRKMKMSFESAGAISAMM